MRNTRELTVLADKDIIEITKLKEHPKNIEVYGKEDVSDLVESISKYGITSPIMVNESFTIISGHRRYKAALELAMSEVPYFIRKFDSPEDEIELLILENAYRNEKTHEQRTREGKALEEVIMVRAKQRRLETLKQNAGTDRAESSHTEKGRTRDNVAKEVGISSGKQFEQSKKVVDEIDNLKANGNEADAELLKTVLNKAPSTAHSLVTKVGVGNLTPDEKEDVRSGKVSPNALVKEKSGEKKIGTAYKEVTDTNSKNNVINNMDYLDKNLDEAENIINLMESSKNVESSETLESKPAEIYLKEIFGGFEQIRNIISNLSEVIYKFEYNSDEAKQLETKILNCNVLLNGFRRHISGLSDLELSRKETI